LVFFLRERVERERTKKLRDGRGDKLEKKQKKRKEKRQEKLITHSDEKCILIT